MRRDPAEATSCSVGCHRRGRESVMSIGPVARRSSLRASRMEYGNEDSWPHRRRPVDSVPVGVTELQALEQVLREIVAEGRADAPRRICEACVAALPLDRAALALMTAADQQEPLWASDDVARELDELQFSLGEGPCVEAFVDRRPVLVADLAEHANSRWPVFAAAALRTP